MRARTAAATRRLGRSADISVQEELVRIGQMQTALPDISGGGCLSSDSIQFSFQLSGIDLADNEPCNQRNDQCHPLIERFFGKIVCVKGITRFCLGDKGLALYGEFLNRIGILAVAEIGGYLLTDVFDARIGKSPWWVLSSTLRTMLTMSTPTPPM